MLTSSLLRNRVLLLESLQLHESYFTITEIFGKKYLFDQWICPEQLRKRALRDERRQCNAFVGIQIRIQRYDFKILAFMLLFSFKFKGPVMCNHTFTKGLIFENIDEGRSVLVYAMLNLWHLGTKDLLSQQASNSLFCIKLRTIRGPSRKEVLRK